MKKAFTLVELAIVLIIIGLITGGVVGAQSLIESANRQTIIKEIRQYKTAFQTFKLEYDYIPGDFPEAESYWGSVTGSCMTSTTAGTCNGDNDKLIDFYSQSFADNRSESWRAWQHMALAEIIPGEYTGISATGCTINEQCVNSGVNTPLSDFGGSASWVMITKPYNTAFNYMGGDRGYGKHLLHLTNPDVTTGTNMSGVWFCPSLTPRQNKSIDDKIDDGKPNFGRISTNLSAHHGNCFNGSGTSMTYNLSSDDVVCGLFAEIE